jgi:hypothetical protein
LENLVRQQISKGSTTPEGYIPYFDHHDNFPLKWAKLIAESPSATSCLSTINSFVQGEGFSDVALETLIIDKKGGTLFQLHQKTVRDFDQNEGFYWLLRFDAFGKVSEWEFLPFENCRLGKPDDSGYISKIYVNAFFGTDEYKGQDKKNTKCYDVFNPAGVREQITNQGAKFKGQVFFFGTTSAMSRFYPINRAYTCSKWMAIEAGVATYHEDSIDNGFLNEFMLIMKGDPSAPSTNPDNADKSVTVAQELEEVVSANFMGKGNQNNLWIQWVNQGDEKPEILTFPSKANGDLFITLDNQATKKITVGWNVPAILANIHEGVSLGGDANTIRVAVKLMQQRVIDQQRVLTDSYSKILKVFYKPYNEDIKITPYNPYPELEVLDDKIWSALSEDEKRQWIQDNTDIDLGLGEAVQEPTIVPNAKFSNAVPIAFPEKVRNKVKTTLDYMDKMQLNCGGKAGVEVSNAILSNSSMGLKQLKRLHSFLKKNDTYANALNSEGCHVIKYNAWGGKDMFDFLESKLPEFESWLN